MTAAESLEVRVQRLEDAEAVYRLGINYVGSIDSGDWKAVADMFTDDAVAGFGLFGHVEGIKAITEFFRDVVPPNLPYKIHKLHNPIIDVSGDTAKAQWHYEVAATSAPSNRAIWIAGRYTVECVKVKGEWKFKVFEAKDFYVTPYDQGWVKNSQYVDYR